MSTDPAAVGEQIVSRPEDLPECCEHLAASRRFGLDTEFVGEDSYHPHLCLLQVATKERLMLIDPLTVGDLAPFWDVVTDPENQVILHAGREEIRLCSLWSGQPPGRFFDLQLAAGLLGLSYPIGHGNLVQQLLRVQIAKGETLTEWRTRPLTRQQVRYAFDDVRYLLPLWSVVHRRLEKHDRLDWADEEFGRLRIAALGEDPTVERWRKLRGAGGLDRRGLGVLRELYHWRDQEALRTNRPARTIVRDDLLVEVARRHPRREHDLQVVRGLQHRHLPAVMEVIERARALPAEQLPRAFEREIDPPQMGPVVNILQAILGDVCGRLRVAPNLAASASDLKMLVRSRIQGTDLPPECLLSQGWRNAAVLPELLAVLDGKRTIRIGDLTSESPFVID